MTYQVLARTWRPQRFPDLLGQEAVVRTLQNALTSDTLGHAYLFSGLRGVGKTTVARLLAKAVNCEHGPTAEPCGECQSCTEIVSSSSLDVVELDGASNRGIDDVRELRELLRYQPTRDRFRVIIIDEVHMLTREAFNALLKSLEEPPPYIIFVFATTERHKVPGTILSRCQQLEFRPVPTGLIAERLQHIAEQEGFSLTPDGAAMIARAADGSVRDALSLIDQLRAFSADQITQESVAAVLGVPPMELTARLISTAAAGDMTATLSTLREQLCTGHDANVLYQEIGRTLKTLLHLSLDPSLEPSLTSEQQQALSAVAQPLGPGALTRMLGLWLEQEPLLLHASNRELALEVACLRLARWPSVQQLEALLTQTAPPTPPLSSEPSPAPSDQSGPAAGSQGTPSPQSRSSSAQQRSTSLAGRLSAAAWEARLPQLAGALEYASAELTAGVLLLRFTPEHTALAEYTSSAVAELRTLARQLELDVGEVTVQVNGQRTLAGEETPRLEELAQHDPQVALVQRIIGGEITKVLPEHDSA